MHDRCVERGASLWFLILLYVGLEGINLLTTDDESGNLLQLQFILTYVGSRYDEKTNEEENKSQREY